ncbi:Uncharacterised protein [Vibrio cholerae]|uniref:Uncharacterized protein n=1 Tax=Vibrio cholerae TaxID=666 RepID=A0A655QYE7_VIBCL|nr:Uncharacterised protein [Vibrio cholerae]
MTHLFDGQFDQLARFRARDFADGINVSRNMAWRAAFAQ